MALVFPYLKNANKPTEKAPLIPQVPKTHNTPSDKPDDPNRECVQEYFNHEINTSEAVIARSKSDEAISLYNSKGYLVYHSGENVDLTT